MSGYGRAYDPRFGSGVAESYPNKYLRPTHMRRPRGHAVTAKHAATISLPLVLPILVLLTLSITLRHDSAGGTLDSQTAVRFAGYFLAGAAAMWALATRKMRMDLSILAWAMVSIFIASTALYAPEPLFGLTAGMAHLALLLFAWQVVNRYGQPRTVFAVVVAGMMVCALSILAFYVFPDFGASTADLLSGDPGGRMRGVTAQPNSLGFISALTILLSIMHFRAFAAGQRVLVGAAICLAAICLYFSDSRTSIAAVLLCLLLWRLCRANAAFSLFSIVALALLASVLVAYIPDIAVHLSRSGTAPDELASLNGRSRIWAVAIENIQAHPLLGQGYGSSSLILPTDDRLFSAALNSHNVYLELLFSGGAALFALYVVALATAIVRSARRRRVEGLIAVLFFLIVGAAEATPYGGLPLYPAFVFYIAVSLCVVRPPFVGRRPTFAMPGQRFADRGR